MFVKSARYYDALYRSKDYESFAATIDRLIQDMSPDATSILDVGCGTGRHLATLSTRYEVEGLDLNPDLLAIARSRMPSAAFHEADMTDFRLDRTFDVIISLFSAAAYVKTKDRYFAAIKSMAAHLNPGGLIFLEPWFTPEAYWVGRLTANYVDEPGLNISWMYISELRDRLSVLDIHYQVGTPEGVSQFREVHEMGLFTREENFAAFAEAGLEATFDEQGFLGRGLYIAKAPR